MYCSSVFGRNIGAHLFYFGFVAIAVTIFISKNKKYLVFATSIPITCLFTLEYFNFSLFEKVSISPIAYKFITYCAYSTSFCIVFLSLYSYWYAENKYKFELNHKTHDLESAQKELQSGHQRDSEYKLARKFQKQYLPELYSYKHIKPSVLHKPSSRMVSGDFYDIRVIDDENIGYFLMDVGGKGLEASYVTVQLHTILRTKITGIKNPKHIMQIINKEVQDLRTLKKMCAGAYLSFNTKTRTLSYSRAALDVLLVLRNGVIIDLDKGSPPLGFSEMHEFVAEDISYQEGDIIIASTDGILDAINPDKKRLGETLFHGFLSSYIPSRDTSLASYLKKELENYTNAEPLADDITVLVFEV